MTTPTRENEMEARSGNAVAREEQRLREQEARWEALLAAEADSEEMRRHASVNNRRELAGGDALRLARECRMEEATPGLFYAGVEDLIRFARLVRAGWTPPRVRCDCSGIGHNGVSPSCPIHAAPSLPTPTIRSPEALSNSTDGGNGNG